MNHPIPIHAYGKHYVDADEIVSVYRDRYTIIVLKNGKKLGCFESVEEIMNLIRQANNNSSSVSMDEGRG